MLSPVLSTPFEWCGIRMRYTILLNVRTGPVNLFFEHGVWPHCKFKAASPKTHRTAIGRRHKQKSHRMRFAVKFCLFSGGQRCGAALVNKFLYRKKSLSQGGKPKFSGLTPITEKSKKWFIWKRGGEKNYEHGRVEIWRQEETDWPQIVATHPSHRCIY